MPRSTTKGLPDRVFWVDENLGSDQFVSRLRVEGLQVKANVFPAGTKDVVWLAEVANRGWVAITQDKLKSDLDEQVALVLHGVQVFVLVGGGRHRDLADLFLRKIKWVRKLLAHSDEAFLGKIYVDTGATQLATLADLCSRSTRRWGR